MIVAQTAEVLRREMLRVLDDANSELPSQVRVALQAARGEAGKATPEQV